MNMKKLFKIIILIKAFHFTLHASALEHMFRALGSDVNVSSSGAFQDQAAGYATGGGVMVRHKNTVFRPIEVSLPHIGMGCNGLDMYMGSFSYFKAEQFGNLLRGIGTNMPSYALQLALKTMSPQMETLLSSLRKAVMDLNALMLDACQMSQQLVGGLWPKNSAASEQICQDMKRQTGEDYFGARQHCSPEHLHEQVDIAKARAENRDLLAGEYNLTWMIAKDKLGLDDALAQFAFTALGTVISIKHGSGYQLQYKKGLLDFPSFWEAHLQGGETTSYTCDETARCLRVAERRTTIRNEDTITERFVRLMDELFESYLQDTRPREEALVLIKDEMGLPLYHYIQVSSALGSRFMLQEALQALSIMVLTRQLETLMGEMEKALLALQGVQIHNDVIKEFHASLQQLKTSLHQREMLCKGESLERLTQMMKGYEMSIIAKQTL